MSETSSAMAGKEPVGCRTVELTADQPHRLVVDYEPVTPPVEESIDDEAVGEDAVVDDPAVEEIQVAIVSTGSTSPRGPNWTASIQVLATDGAGVVLGTSVEVVYRARTPTTMGCVTDTDGTCTLTQLNLHNRDNPATATVFRVGDDVVAGPTVTISR